MNKSRLVFFLVVLGIVFAIARCNSKRLAQTNPPRPASVRSTPASSLLIPPPNPSPVATPTPAPVMAQTAPQVDFKKIAGRIIPSVIGLSVFDASGKLLHHGTGFFVSEDGTFVTSRSIIDGGTNAVAKAADGKIYNVTGILAEAPPADLALLKAEVKERVPFITPTKMAPFLTGGRLAAIGSPSHRPENTVTETTIAGRKWDANSEWLELTAPVPGESLGGPVLNDNGDVLGFVTLQRGQGPAVNVVRMASALDSLFARVDKHAKPTWAAVAAPGSPAEGPSPKPTPAPRMRLTYNPTPKYPAEARHAFFPVKGSGRYRVSFRSDGSARDVQILQSTRSQTLDAAAVEALRKWKATPGQDWSADVPITFQP
jgi:TonB family protein